MFALLKKMKKKLLLLFSLFSLHQGLSAKDVPMIGVYSGSFDPPTKAHHKIISKIIAEQKFDALIVYVNRYGSKSFQVSPEQRKSMLETMLEGEVVTVVIQSNPDKRIDYQKMREPGQGLALIIGEDSYFKRLALPEEQRISVDRIFVIPRFSVFTDLEAALGSNAHILYVPNIQDISSTRIRRQLQLGDLSEIALEEGVLRYIVENHLYSVSENVGSQGDGT